MLWTVPTRRELWSHECRPETQKAAHQPATAFALLPTPRVGLVRTAKALEHRLVLHPLPGKCGERLRPHLPTNTGMAGRINGRAAEPPGIATNASSMAFLEMESQAPTPLIDTIVICGSISVHAPRTPFRPWQTSRTDGVRSLLPRLCRSCVRQIYGEHPQQRFL